MEGRQNPVPDCQKFQTLLPERRGKEKHLLLINMLLFESSFFSCLLENHTDLIFQ